MIVKGGLLDALCAEPALDALSRTLPNISLTVVSANADVFVGHPGVGGIVYPDENNPVPDDGSLVIPAASSAASMAERIDSAARALGVTLERRCPHMVMTSLDIIRTERFELGRPEQVIVGLSLCRQENEAPAQRRRWERVCELLETQWDAAIVLLCGPTAALRVHKNLVGRLMPREAAAVLARCTVWLGDEPAYAAMAQAVGTPGVFVSDTPLFTSGPRDGVCPASASDRDILEAVQSVRRQENPSINRL